MDQLGVRPTRFQIGTIITTLGLSIESHHRTSSSRLLRTFLLLSYLKDPCVWAEWEKTYRTVMLISLFTKS